MENDRLELLAFLYTFAFLAGSLWNLVLPSHQPTLVTQMFYEVLPGQEPLMFFVVLPVVSGLFFGLVGIGACFSLGYANREIFRFAAELLETDLSGGYAIQAPPSVEVFMGYGACLLLAISGSVLGAAFSYLHEDAKGEMLVSALIYALAVALLLFFAPQGVYP